MISLQRKERGFTIVELLIVIVVIGILAALVITTFSGIQRKARDTERTTDIKAIHGQVEAYYAQNGRYPTLADLNNATFISDDLKGLDDGALQDPKGANGTIVAAPAANAYAYDVAGEDGTTDCDNAENGTDCMTYTLTATLEGEGDTYVKTQLN